MRHIIHKCILRMWLLVNTYVYSKVLVFVVYFIIKSPCEDRQLVSTELPRLAPLVVRCSFSSLLAGGVYWQVTTSNSWPHRSRPLGLERICTETTRQKMHAYVCPRCRTPIKRARPHIYDYLTFKVEQYSYVACPRNITLLSFRYLVWLFTPCGCSATDSRSYLTYVHVLLVPRGGVRSRSSDFWNNVFSSRATIPNTPVGSFHPFKDPPSWRTPPNIWAVNFHFLFSFRHNICEVMTYNIFKVRNKNGNLRLRYSGGVLHEKGSLNGRKLPTVLTSTAPNSNAFDNSNVLYYETFCLL